MNAVNTKNEENMVVWSDFLLGRKEVYFPLFHIFEFGIWIHFCPYAAAVSPSKASPRSREVGNGRSAIRVDFEAWTTSSRLGMQWAWRGRDSGRGFFQREFEWRELLFNPPVCVGSHASPVCGWGFLYLVYRWFECMSALSLCTFVALIADLHSWLGS